MTFFLSIRAQRMFHFYHILRDKGFPGNVTAWTSRTFIQVLICVDVLFPNYFTQNSSASIKQRYMKEEQLQLLITNC